MALSRSRNVAAAVLVVAVGLGFGSAALVVPKTDPLVSRGTLTVVDGAVFTSHGDGDFTPARETDVLVARDTIRTGPGAAAEITYFDGSSVRIEGDADFVVERSSRSDGAPRMLGRAWRVITKLFTGDSRYEVRTPSSTASLRG